MRKRTGRQFLLNFFGTRNASAEATLPVTTMRSSRLWIGKNETAGSRATLSVAFFGSVSLLARCLLLDVAEPVGFAIVFVCVFAVRVHRRTVALQSLCQSNHMLALKRCQRLAGL